MGLLHRNSRGVAEQIQKFPAFAGCTVEDLIVLVEIGQLFEHPAEWVVMSEGVPADAVYIITEGTGSVYKGRDIIGSIGPGDVVGEMALLAGGQRRATITSNTHMSGLRVEHEWLSRVMNKRPNLRDAFTAVFHNHAQTDAARASSVSQSGTE